MRLLRTPTPYSDESLMGYILRLTEANFYPSPQWIFSDLDWKINIANGWYHLINYWNNHYDFGLYTGKSDEQLKSFELHSKDSDNIELLGQQIPYACFQFKHSRVCPDCLKDANYYRKYWDIILITACLQHYKLLVDTCPECKNKISWARNNIKICKCGYDLSKIEAKSIDAPTVKYNSVIFESLALPTTYNLQSSTTFNPLRGVPFKLLSDLIFSLASFLRQKDKSKTFLEGADDEIWQKYALEVIEYFDNYPTEIENLFKLAGRSTDNYESHNLFIEAIRFSCRNDYLFFLIIAFSEFERGTNNYPESEEIPTIRNKYIDGNHILIELGINESIVVRLIQLGLVISLQSYSSFLGEELFIHRENLNIIREKLNSSVTFNAAKEILHLSYSEMLLLMRLGLLNPTDDPCFSDPAEIRFKIEDIEKLVNEFKVDIHHRIFEYKNGKAYKRPFKNELSDLLNSILDFEKLFINKHKIFANLQNEDLFKDFPTKDKIESFLNEKHDDLVQLEKNTIRRAALFLREKMTEKENSFNRKFNFDKHPFLSEVYTSKLLKSRLRKYYKSRSLM